jgi:hypothetical protein
MQRREFLGAFALAALARRLPAPSLRLTLIGGNTDEKRGGEMALEEAARAAQLFGGGIELAEAPGSGARVRVAFDGGTDALYFDLTRASGCARDAFGIATSTGWAWVPALTRFGADSLNKRYRARYGEPMTSDAWCAWFAVKCAWEAALKSGARDAKGLITYLERPSSRFDGHKGVALFFDASHRLVQPAYDARGEELPRTANSPKCDWKS